MVRKKKAITLMYGLAWLGKREVEQTPAEGMEL